MNENREFRSAGHFLVCVLWDVAKPVIIFIAEFIALIVTILLLLRMYNSL